MNEVRAPAELVADLEAWLLANNGVVDTPVPGTVAELMGRIVMRWHNRKVAGLEGARDGARQARDIALEDNQRLREEMDSMKAALRARDAVIARLEDEAHAEPPGTIPFSPTRHTGLRLGAPVCVRCGQPLQPGLNVGYWVQADGTIRPGHYECHRPEEGAQR